MIKISNKKKGYLLIIVILVSTIILSIFQQVETYTTNAELEQIELETGHVRPLVVLFCTTNRLWANTCQNHIEVIRKITGTDDNNQVVLGIHHWSNDTEQDIPDLMKQYDYKRTVSDQLVEHQMKGSPLWHSNIIKNFCYSLHFALENAEEVFSKKYGYEMPDNQVIIRFRCDSKWYNLENFQLPIINNDDFYMTAGSIKNEYKNLISDIIFYTTKKSIRKIIEFVRNRHANDNSMSEQPGLDKFIEELDPSTIHESYTFNLLKRCNIPAYYSTDMYPSLYRSEIQLDKQTW